LIMVINARSSSRIKPELKRALEDEARRQRVTASELLDQILKDWLDERVREDEAEQTRLHAIVAKCIGTISGGDPHASEKVGEIVRAAIMERYKQGRL